MLKINIALVSVSNFNNGEYVTMTAGSDVVVYAKIKEVQANGRLKVLAFTSIDGKISGKAKNISMPIEDRLTLIDSSDIPPKILAKLK